MASGYTAFLALRFIGGVRLNCLIADRINLVFVCIGEEEQVRGDMSTWLTQRIEFLLFYFEETEFDIHTNKR